MGDKLEQFIQNNQHRLDTEEPGERIWEKIDGDLRVKPESKRSWQVYWKVAAMVFLVSTVVLLIDKFNPEKVSETAELSEFIQAENFYTSLIAERKVQIETYDSHGSLYREFLDDMNELDDLYLELRASFEHTHGDQKLMDAMISNLRLRMKILDRQIEILERINDFEENESEKPASA